MLILDANERFQINEQQRKHSHFSKCYHVNFILLQTLPKEIRIRTSAEPGAIPIKTNHFSDGSHL